VSRRPRNPPATAKAEATRRRVLEAALALFAERGFEETTMRDVARRAGLATGAAYYYFASKEELILEFYRESMSATDDRARTLVASPGGDLKSRLAGLLELRFEHFAPHRASLGALFRSAADPASPISPFGERTRAIREAAIDLFRQALASSTTRPPKDIAPHLPRLLWLYQMGLILFWIYDRSEDQARTKRLMDRSLDLVVGLIRISKFPLMRPLRKAVVEMLAAVPGE
jgi:AcrR family transcriptional regulator